MIALAPPPQANSFPMTWEEAVRWLRAQPDSQELVRQCYYDDPLPEAAERFRRSEEWRATCRLLAGRLPCSVLDLGAGRGIASYAFAAAGCKVTALEPDPGPVVGRAVIQTLARQTGMNITTVAGIGEALPFDDKQFDVVYGRAILHHARHLPTLCREIRRVLRPGGAALLVREHVISRREDLQTFLDGHPLHGRYGGENAYLLDEYQAALTQAGLQLTHVLGPLESAVNYHPAAHTDVNGHVTGVLSQRLRFARRWCRPLARLLLALPGSRGFVTRQVSRRDETPGRLYSFLGVNP